MPSSLLFVQFCVCHVCSSTGGFPPGTPVSTQKISVLLQFFFLLLFFMCLYSFHDVNMYSKLCNPPHSTLSHSSTGGFPPGTPVSTR